MGVRAKFVCDTITRELGSTRDPATGDWVQSEVHTIKFSPVYHGDDPQHENSKFWSATPSGSIQFACVNPDAVAQFEPGGQYYVDFTKAD